MGISGKFPQMCPCDLKEENGGRIFVYNIAGKIDVADFLKKDINKVQMLTFLYNVLGAFENFGKNMISLSYVVKDIHYIFVNPDSLEVSMIIVMAGRESADLNENRELIRNILAGSRYVEMDADNYVARLITYLNKADMFSAGDMKRLVESMLRDTGIDIEEEKQEKSVDIEALQPMPAVSQPMPAVSQPMPAVSQPALSHPVPEASQSQQIPVPYLLRIKTQDKIYIDKPEFTFGKSASKADYAIADNKAVSRSHCTILRKNGVSFIEDNKSTNGTFVNGKNIAGEQNIFLTNGASVVMGDEEFVYFVR
jgi:hypothetical protein